MKAIHSLDGDDIFARGQIMREKAPAAGSGPIFHLFTIEEEAIEDPVTVRIYSLCSPDDRCALCLRAGHARLEALQNRRMVDNGISFCGLTGDGAVPCWILGRVDIFWHGIYLFI